jgi:Zn-dependent protease with chaperone function
MPRGVLLITAVVAVASNPSARQREREADEGANAG